MCLPPYNSWFIHPTNNWIGFGQDDWGIVVCFRWRQPIFLRFEASRPSLGLTQTCTECSNLAKNLFHEMKRDAMPLVNGYRHFGLTFCRHFQVTRRFNGDLPFLGFHFSGIWLVGNQIPTCGLLEIRIIRHLEMLASDYLLGQGNVPEENNSRLHGCESIEN